MNQDISAILIDDDPVVHAMWEFAAAKKNKNIISFYFVQDFFEYCLSNYLLNYIPIYIDLNLGNKLTGEVIARDIYKLGYTNIYLITGEDRQLSRDVYWIKEILGKEPPW